VEPANGRHSHPVTHSIRDKKRHQKLLRGTYILSSTEGHVRTPKEAELTMGTHILLSAEV